MKSKYSRWLKKCLAHGTQLTMIMLVLSACGKSPDKTDSPVGQPAASVPDPTPEPAPGVPEPTPAPTPDMPDEPDAVPQPPQKPGQPKPKPQPKPPVPKPQPKPEPVSPGLGAPAWGVSPARKPWVSAILSVVHARIGELEKAQDKEVFCPGYSKATPSQKANCWVLIVAAISKFESSFNPDSQFREPDGNYSIGLLALSPGECPNAPSHQSLKAATPNLICGTNKMASLIGRHGYIDGPVEGRRGAAQYWSTLRTPYTRWDPTRGRYLNLGKRNLILPLVRNYKGKSRALLETASYQADAEEQLANEIAAWPVHHDGFGYHSEE